MSKRQLLCIIGAWSIVFLFLGFPSSWDKIFGIVCGLSTIAIAYNLKTERQVSNTVVKNGNITSPIVGE
jgi:hypothetical protein